MAYEDTKYWFWNKGTGFPSGGAVLGWAREAGGDGIYGFTLGDSTGTAAAKYPMGGTSSGAEYLRSVPPSVAPGTITNGSMVHTPLEYEP